MPEDMPDRMPNRMPDRMPEDMSEYMPEDMPDRMPDWMPEDMSDRVPEDMPDRMPEDLPDRMPEDMPEDMPDHMPEDMPDRMPNRMSEDMSDRMPEDLPVRKCINVMVGITRSKVIIFPYTVNNHPNWLIFFRGLKPPISYSPPVYSTRDGFHFIFPIEKSAAFSCRIGIGVGHVSHHWGSGGCLWPPGGHSSYFSRWKSIGKPWGNP